MYVELYIPIGNDYDQAKAACERAEGLHIRSGSDDQVMVKSPWNFEYGLLFKVEPTRIAELAAELVREGWCD